MPDLRCAAELQALGIAMQTRAPRPHNSRAFSRRSATKMPLRTPRRAKSSQVLARVSEQNSSNVSMPSACQRHDPPGTRSQRHNARWRRPGTGRPPASDGAVEASGRCQAPAGGRPNLRWAPVSETALMIGFDMMHLSSWPSTRAAWARLLQHQHRHIVRGQQVNDLPIGRAQRSVAPVLVHVQLEALNAHVP